MVPKISRSSLWTFGLAILLTGIAVLLLVDESTLAFFGVVPLFIWAVAACPQAAVVFAVPLLVLPLPIEIAGVSSQFVLLAMLEFGVLLRYWRRLRRFSLLAVLLAVAAAMLAVSYVFNSREVVSDSATRSALIGLLLCLGAVLAVALAAPNPHLLLEVLVISGAASMAYSIVVSRLSLSGRLTTDVLNANSLGHVAAVTIVGAIACTWLFKNPWWLVPLLPSAYVLLGTHSRASFIMVGVGVGVFVFTGLTRRLKILAPVALACIGVVVLVVEQLTGGIEFTAGRSEAAADSSTDQRSELLQLALRLIGENPISGVGFRAFPDYSFDVFRFGLNTHNDYVRIAVEAGIPALLCLLAIAIVPMVARGGDTPTRRICLALVSASAVSFFFGNTMSLLAVSLPFWFALGLLWRQREEASAVDGITIYAPLPRRDTFRAGSLVLR